MAHAPMPPADPLPAGVSLPSAGDLEQLVRAHGTTFLVTNRHGDVAPPGARESPCARGTAERT